MELFYKMPPRTLAESAHLLKKDTIQTITTVLNFPVRVPDAGVYFTVIIFNQ